MLQSRPIREEELSALFVTIVDVETRRAGIHVTGDRPYAVGIVAGQEFNIATAQFT